MKTRRRIAIVEDDPAIGGMLRDVLKMEGFEVTLLKDGHAALPALSDGRYDAAVLDVMLPGADGITILQHIRQRSCNDRLPVVMLTAKTDDETTWQGWKAGANYFMNKPFDPEELVRVLRSVVD